MRFPRFKSTAGPITLVIAGMFPIILATAAEKEDANPIEVLELPTVEVIGTTPLPTLGIPKDQVPSNVQGGTSKQIENQNTLSIADFMNQNIGNLNINEIGTNPFQPDVNYRGFARYAAGLIGVSRRCAHQRAVRRYRQLGFNSARRDLVDEFDPRFESALRPEHIGRCVGNSYQIRAAAPRPRR